MVGSPAPSQSRLAHKSRRSDLQVTAAILIVFGACGWVAADVVIPMLRGGGERVTAIPTVTVVSYDARGAVVVAGTPAGVLIPVGTARVPYGCSSVIAIGHLSIGQACGARILSVAATR